MTITLLGLDDGGSWNSHLQSVPCAFPHTWHYCRAMHLTTGLTTYLWCYDGPNVQVICPFAERRFKDTFDIVTPLGFSGFVGSGDCPGVRDIWKTWCRSRGYVAGYVALNPILVNRSYVDASEVHAAQTLFILDLRQSEAALFEGLHASHRRKHRAMAPTTISTEASGALAKFFIDNFETCFQSRHGSAAYGLSRESLHALVASPGTFLVGAHDGGTIESVTLFGYTPHCGDAFLNVCTDTGREHAFTLEWTGAHFLKSLGVPFLNVGGGVREGDGVTQFKRRYGGMERPFEALKQVYDEERYKALCDAAGADSSSRSGFFPAYRAAVS